MGSSLRSYAEVAGALRSPYAADELVIAGEAPILAVDLAGEEAGADGAGPDGAAEALRRLPAVTVAVVDGSALPAPARSGAGAHPALAPVPGAGAGPVARRAPVAGPEPVVAAFDVVLDGSHAGAGAALDALVAAAAAQPLAAVAAVQLLRLSASLGVVDGLVAESFAYSTLQAGPGFGAWLAARRAGGPPSAGPPAADAEPLRVARDGAELRLTFNRPEVHNAFGFAVRDALVEAVRLAVADRTVESVVLDGRGPSFCSGGDLREFGTFGDPLSAHLVRTGRSAGYWLHRISDRLTAHLHGWCIGSGIELAAFAGRVRAAPDVEIALPEVGMGLVPGAGGTVSLPRRIGRHRTAHLCLSGERIEARLARAWDLVDELDH